MNSPPTGIGLEKDKKSLTQASSCAMRLTLLNCFFMSLLFSCPTPFSLILEMVRIIFSFLVRRFKASLWIGLRLRPEKLGVFTPKLRPLCQNGTTIKVANAHRQPRLAMAARRTLALLFAPREHALSHLSEQNHAKCLGVVVLMLHSFLRFSTMEASRNDVRCDNCYSIHYSIL